MLCNSCDGSGNIFFPKRWRSVAKSFIDCRVCDGSGVINGTFGSKILWVKTRGFVAHPDWEREQDQNLHQLMVKRINNRNNKRKS